ncbi:cytochrome b [Haloarcula litorea]|uniref:cytochrome b n=1 Tax=Haloarcula litorea TaxID=3032579 RepID=UPI0023E8F9A6|nr:cytochrome b N-terminal domain-containing protein [Halomicroarcula sp. GDY20]
MSLDRPDPHDHREWLRTRELTLLERAYLTALIWLDRRLRVVDYLEFVETLYYKVNMQLPKSHTEQYNLDNKFWYWYPLYTLGSFSVVAYVVAAVTGALLGFYYAPAAASASGQPTVAYDSVLLVMGQLNLGYFLRSVHRWAAQVMVAAVFLHMLRVYFTGAYKEPRELNWLIGVVLVSLTLWFGYSGYLLPWSQLSYWAGQIGIELFLSVPLVGEWLAQLLFGGFSLSQATLVRMYIMHVFVMPFVTTALIAIHIGIVWMQGIAEPH